MKIGVSTSCFYPVETEIALEEIGKAGVKVTEVFFNAQSELKPAFCVEKHFGNFYPRFADFF